MWGMKGRWSEQGKKSTNTSWVLKGYGIALKVKGHIRSSCQSMNDGTLAISFDWKGWWCGTFWNQWSKEAWQIWFLIEDTCGLVKECKGEEAEPGSNPFGSNGWCVLYFHWTVPSSRIFLGTPPQCKVFIYVTDRWEIPRKIEEQIPLYPLYCCVKKTRVQGLIRWWWRGG